MNKIEIFKNSQDNIVYINDAPYYEIFRETDSLVRIGSRGEQIKSAGVYEGSVFKVTDNNKCFVGRYNKDFRLLKEDVVGAFVNNSQELILLTPDGKIFAYDIKTPKLSFKYEDNMKGLHNIDNVYTFDRSPYVVIQDRQKGLFLWDGERALQTIKIPGNTVLDRTSFYYPSHGFSTHFVLTDEGLYVFCPSNKQGGVPLYISKSGEESTHLSSSQVKFYKIPLPEGISPSDVSGMEISNITNLFLLTNDGKVYSVGKNGYYQRGTTKKLKIDEWNEIKYPEKMKQIASIITYPILFALSENGNLYYHGYNENGYYPVTGRKSNVSKPLKIAENIKSVWASGISLSFPLNNAKHIETHPVFLVDNNGDFYMIPHKFLAGRKHNLIESPKKVYPVVMYNLLRNDLLFTPNMISVMVKNNC